MSAPGAEAPGLAWVVNAYVLSFAVLLLCATIAFLESYEPDLVAVAEAIGADALHLCIADHATEDLEEALVLHA